MQAAYITKNGSADDIIIGDLPKPIISANQVLIKVNAVAVNHVDTFVRSGAFQTDTDFPFVISRDAVGQVEEVGKDVTGFSKGNWVWTNLQPFRLTGYFMCRKMSNQLSSLLRCTRRPLPQLY